jgi:hypothetical protein
MLNISQPEKLNANSYGFHGPGFEILWVKRYLLYNSPDQAWGPYKEWVPGLSPGLNDGGIVSTTYTQLLLRLSIGITISTLLTYITTYFKSFNITYVLQAKSHANTLHPLSMQLAISINFSDFDRNAM